MHTRDHRLWLIAGPLRAALFVALVVAGRAAAQEADKPQAKTPQQLIEEGDKKGAAQAFIEEAKAGKVEERAKVLQEAVKLLPDQQAKLLPELARAVEAAGKPADAAEQWEAAANAQMGTVQAVDALRSAGRLWAAAGDDEKALNALEQVIEGYDDALEAYREQTGVSTYHKNRRALDRGSALGDTRARLAALKSKTGDAAGAAELWRTILRDDAHAPITRRAELQVARACAASNDWPQALVHALRFLDNTGDRTTPGKTRFADNQAYLNAVSTPATEEDLRAALGLVQTAALNLKAAAPLTDQQFDEACARWREAEAAAYAGDLDKAFGEWAKLREALPDSIIANLAALAAAQWAQWHGRFHEAERLYARTPPENPTLRAVGDWAAYGRAELALAAGDPGAARKLLERVTSSPDRALADRAYLRIGESYEEQWAVGKAAATYGSLAKSAYRSEEGALAAHAAKRVARLRDKFADLAAGPAEGIAYLREDRCTGGDWMSRYGREMFALMAAESPSSVCGGGLWPIKLGAKCIDDKDTVRAWLTGPHAYHPSVLYNLIGHRWRASNLDDHGEQHPIGEGPGISILINVPEGLHQLSLYFANDFDYYEPSRRYTVYVIDYKTKQLAAATTVEYFLNGVYKQFAVEGPRLVRILLMRDLSINPTSAPGGLVEFFED